MILVLAIAYLLLVGLGLSAAARQGLSFKTVADLMRFVTANMTRELQDVDWQKQLEKKKLEYPSEGG